MTITVAVASDHWGMHNRFRDQRSSLDCHWNIHLASYWDDHWVWRIHWDWMGYFKILSDGIKIRLWYTLRRLNNNVRNL